MYETQGFHDIFDFYINRNSSGTGSVQQPSSPEWPAGRQAGAFHRKQIVKLEKHIDVAYHRVVDNYLSADYPSFVDTLSLSETTFLFFEFSGELVPVKVMKAKLAELIGKDHEGFFLALPDNAENLEEFAEAAMVLGRMEEEEGNTKQT